METAKNCRNCGAERFGDYCQVCGQKYDEDRDYSLKALAGEGISEFTSLDSRVWNTLKLLLTKPGLLTLEYWQGKRVKYVKPLRLYLIIATAYFFIGSSTFVDLETIFGVLAQDGGQSGANIDRVLTQIGETRGLTSEQVVEKTNSIFQTIFKLINPAFALIFAFIMKLFFRKNKEYYFEHLIFALHYFAFEQLFAMVWGTTLLLFKDVLLLSTVSVIVGIIYLQLSGKRAYQIRGKRATLKLLIAWSINYGIRLLSVAISMVIAFLIVARG